MATSDGDRKRARSSTRATYQARSTGCTCTTNWNTNVREFRNCAYPARQQLFLLCFVHLRQRLLRSGYLQYGAVLGLPTGAKARHAILYGGEVHADLGGRVTHDDGSSSWSTPLPQPRLGLRSAQPEGATRHHSPGSGSGRHQRSRRGVTACARTANTHSSSGRLPGWTSANPIPKSRRSPASAPRTGIGATVS